MAFGLFHATREQADGPEDLHRLNPVLRVQLACRPHLEVGVLEQADVKIGDREIEMRHVEAGVELERTPALANHGVPVVLLKTMYGRNRRVRLGQIGIQLKRPAGFPPRPSIPDLRALLRREADAQLRRGGG